MEFVRFIKFLVNLKLCSIRKSEHHNQYKTQEINRFMDIEVYIDLKGTISKEMLEKLEKGESLGIKFDCQIKRPKREPPIIKKEIYALLNFSSQQKTDLISNYSADELYEEGKDNLSFSIGKKFYYALREGNKFSAKIPRQTKNLDAKLHLSPTDN